MKYHFRIHKEEVGRYWSEGIELPRCVTQADSLPELKEFLKDDLDLFLDEPQCSNVTFPLSNESIGKNNLFYVLKRICKSKTYS